MSNLQKKLDSNDFWLDCIKDPVITAPNNKSSKNLFLNPLSLYIEKAKRNKKKYKHDTKPSYQNSKIIEQALKSEESIVKNKRKSKKSFDYFNSLYTRGMLFKQKKNKLMTKNNQMDFTFEKNYANINIKRYKNLILQKRIKKHFGNSTIYERGIKFQQKKIEKIAKLFEENNRRINIVYPFHPDISFKNLNHVFFSDNYCKEQAENDSNKIFISRLMKARAENKLKQDFYENNQNKNINKWDHRKRLKKSLSQKDSLLFRKELHNSLLDLKCLPTNESNTNTNINNNDIDEE